ncbi:MAG: Na+/H+ antiporter NhaC family protein, partial [Clostridia bacterium]|nr:Na+/H+ antiporter NhaC family protein [Clostridia bacterium]
MKRMTTKKWLLLFVVMAVVVATAACAGTGATGNPFIGTFWAVIPPLVAIVLALITKEVYLSLFLGILVGTLFYTNFSPIGTITGIFGSPDEGIGLLSAVCDSYNAGILIFLVCLGIIGALITKAGGSAAFGRWAEKNIKSKAGAQFATMILGVLIFVDDYFNCLTVGSVMRPVTDKHNISRAKLAYLIDSTAAPVCIIAPISSWAAAVAGSLEETGGYSSFELFTNSIPFNFYAILTLVFIVCITFMKFDYGPMKLHELNAAKGDLFTSGREQFQGIEEEKVSPRGRVIDL